MKRLAGLALGLMLLAAGPAAAEVHAGKLYVSPDQLDTTRFMAPPPSAETSRRELDELLGSARSLSLGRPKVGPEGSARE